MLKNILTDPQSVSDANGLAIFASAVSQVANKIFHGAHQDGVEYPDEVKAEMKVYVKENFSKLKSIIERLEADIELA